MAIAALDNLVKINKLKQEPPDAQEFNGMLKAAKTKLEDASLQGLSVDSQFSLAYSADMRYRWLHCVIAAIEVINAILFFSVCNIPSISQRQNGACWTNATMAEIWQSMKGI